MTVPITSCPLLPPILDSFAVIVPVHNAVKTPERRHVFQDTLTSIATALDFFDHHYRYRDRVTWEAILVDDGSTDGTLDAIVAWVCDCPGWGLARHPHNLGPGAARNSGVNLSRAAALFFCDSDDRYRPEHFLAAFAALNAPLPPGETVPSSPLPSIPDRYPGTVKTAIAFSDPIHPDWQYALQQTLLQNRAVRRDLHDFVGGFPEVEIFRRGDEDSAYNYLCAPFAPAVFLPTATVEYQRHPGNAFDRQLAKFQHPMAEATQDLSPTDWERMRQQGIYARDRVHKLKEKIQAMAI